MIKIISDASKNQNKPLSICGEMATNPKYVEKLLELGINNFSVSPKLISNIRKYFINKN